VPPLRAVLPSLLLREAVNYGLIYLSLVNECAPDPIRVINVINTTSVIVTVLRIPVSPMNHVAYEEPFHNTDNSVCEDRSGTGIHSQLQHEYLKLPQALTRAPPPSKMSPTMRPCYIFVNEEDELSMREIGTRFQALINTGCEIVHEGSPYEVFSKSIRWNAQDLL
jgi:hypothetical protein